MCRRNCAAKPCMRAIWAFVHTMPSRWLFSPAGWATAAVWHTERKLPFQVLDVNGQAVFEGKTTLAKAADCKR